jgi:LAO/AO transport system kinase
MSEQLKFQLIEGDIKSLARCISLVENEAPGYEAFMQSLNTSNKGQIIGITGPPGAGKSTITDALIGAFTTDNKKVAVLCVDPSSPFNLGALLGDRIRMSEWYNNPNVYIRSLASRGSLGGLNPKIIEISEIIKAAEFDIVIIETVGVGQSEIEIAGLADVTVVVLVPESGDEIQTMKAGLMEIADIFVVNKSDREGADAFINTLKQMLAPVFHHKQQEIPIVKTIASTKEGIELLKEKITASNTSKVNDRKSWLLAERAYQLIRSKRMQDVEKSVLKKEIEKNEGLINLYQFIKKYY